MIFLQTHFFTVYSPLPPVGGVDPGILREPGFVPESHHLHTHCAAKVARDGAIAFVVGWKMKNKLEWTTEAYLYSWKPFAKGASSSITRHVSRVGIRCCKYDFAKSLLLLRSSIELFLHLPFNMIDLVPCVWHIFNFFLLPNVKNISGKTIRLRPPISSPRVSRRRRMKRVMVRTRKERFSAGGKR